MIYSSSSSNYHEEISNYTSKPNNDNHTPIYPICRSSASEDPSPRQRRKSRPFRPRWSSWHRCTTGKALPTQDWPLNVAPWNPGYYFWTVECFLTLCRSLTKACAKKCVPNDYRESELNKGESVCLDRCAAKFFDVHMKVSEQLQQEMQQKGVGGGSGGFGFGG